MRILILGGTRFVGRAAAEYAVTTGDDVTLVNRGTSPGPAGVTTVIADRRVEGDLDRALAGRGDWDLVFDTWSAEPRVVARAADTLADRAAHYAYVSSRSVYHWPPSAVDESARTVDGDPDAASTGDYAADKRGAELAVQRAFGESSTLARAGLILGPRENIGRLAYWLHRFAENDGTTVLAPGRPERPLQYVDARDLSAWLIEAGRNGTGGAFDVVSRTGHATMGSLLEAVALATGVRPDLRWVEEEVLLGEGITGWVDLPIWAPESTEYAALHSSDVEAAYSAGLRCRPVLETVIDTWVALGKEPAPPAPPGRDLGYLSREREAQLLALGG